MSVGIWWWSAWQKGKFLIYQNCCFLSGLCSQKTVKLLRPKALLSLYIENACKRASTIKKATAKYCKQKATNQLAAVCIDMSMRAFIPFAGCTWGASQVRAVQLTDPLIPRKCMHRMNNLHNRRLWHSEFVHLEMQRTHRNIVWLFEEGVPSCGRIHTDCSRENAGAEDILGWFCVCKAACTIIFYQQSQRAHGTNRRHYRFWTLAWTWPIIFSWVWINYSCATGSKCRSIVCIGQVSQLSARLWSIIRVWLSIWHVVSTGVYCMFVTMIMVSLLWSMCGQVCKLEVVLCGMIAHRFPWTLINQHGLNKRCITGCV